MIAVWLHNTLVSTVMTEGVQDWIGPAYNYMMARKGWQVISSKMAIVCTWKSCIVMCWWNLLAMRNGSGFLSLVVPYTVFLGTPCVHPVQHWGSGKKHYVALSKIHEESIYTLFVLNHIVILSIFELQTMSLLSEIRTAFTIHHSYSWCTTVWW